MPKNRLAVLVLMLIATSVFLVTAVRRAARRTSGESGRAAEFLDVTRDAAMGTLPHTRGEASAPYVTVEFADYQCPPCKAESLTVARLLARYHTHVRLVFRNYPLAMHPYSEYAAIAAEEAPNSESYWRMHDALYSHQEELSGACVGALASRIIGTKAADPTVRAAAARRVSADAGAAKLLGVVATPTFILVCPDNRVVKLGRLDQVSEFAE